MSNNTEEPALTDLHLDSKQMFETQKGHGEAIVGLEKGLAEVRVSIDGVARSQEAQVLSVNRGFESLRKQILDLNKPKQSQWVQISSLVVAASIGVAGILSLIVTGNQREADLRFNDVDKEFAAYESSIEDIVERMKTDDKREQQDAFDKGQAKANYEFLTKTVLLMAEQNRTSERFLEQQILESALLSKENEVSIDSMEAYFRERRLGVLE